MTTKTFAYVCTALWVVAIVTLVLPVEFWALPFAIVVLPVAWIFFYSFGEIALEYRLLFERMAAEALAQKEKTHGA